MDEPLCSALLVVPTVICSGFGSSHFMKRRMVLEIASSVYLLPPATCRVLVAISVVKLSITRALYLFYWH